MSLIKFRHGKKFPPRVSREELYDRTNQRVKECGVNNHFQAVFTHNIAQEVVGLKDFKYESLQPELKLKDSLAWKYAFTVAQHYLDDFQMETTSQTITIELQGKKLPKNENILKNTNSVSYLTKLIENDLPSFSELVDQFAKEEDIPETNKGTTISAQKYTQKEKDKLFQSKPMKNPESSKTITPTPAQKLPQPNKQLSKPTTSTSSSIKENPNAKAPAPSSSVQQPPPVDTLDERFSDQFEYSLEGESDVTNGKMISSTVFSKSDYTIAVDELQSDDGKQTAANQQLLQEIMNEAEQKPEIKPVETVKPVQGHSEVDDDFSDIDVELHADSNSDDFNTNQASVSNQDAAEKDSNVEIDADFESDLSTKEESSPVKQTETKQPSQKQSTVTNEVEEFGSDDFNADFDEDINQESEKEKEESTPPKTSSPQKDNNDEIDIDNDFENDVEIENDFDNDEENNSPKKPSNIELDKPNENVSGSFNEDSEAVDEDDVDVNIDVDVDVENDNSDKPKEESNNKLAEDSHKDTESDNFDVDFDDFDLDDN